MPAKPPDEIYQATVDNGIRKAACSTRTAWVMTFLAGAYIALGAFLALRTGGALPYDVWGSLGKFVFAVVFPVGLMLVVICGADLFTGNCLTLTAGCCSRQISFARTLRGWVLSWCGNFAGALFVAYCIAYLSGLIFDTVTVQGRETMPWATSIVNIANTKCHLGFAEAFWRGVGCNWLVCLAVYAATAAHDVTGKIVALWMPTAAFVALGMEHCVANMFFIPLGIMTGGDPRYLALASAGGQPLLHSTWGDFLVNNMIPVTLGNVAGGAILVAGAYGLAYVRTVKKQKP